MAWLKEITAAFLVIFLAGTLFMVIYQSDRMYKEQLTASYPARN